MNTQENTKVRLYQYLQDRVAQQIDLLEGDIHSAEEARDKESKSSVGDKYETGRAMMQQEIFRKKEQLQKAMETKLTLSTIKPTERHSMIQLGSLVKTVQGYFYLSVGMGKISLDNQLYFAISIRSPIGAAMLGKKEGTAFEFRGKQIRIERIL